MDATTQENLWAEVSATVEHSYFQFYLYIPNLLLITYRIALLCWSTPLKFSVEQDVVYWFYFVVVLFGIDIDIVSE
jgi:hypothetical protein